MKLKTVSWKKLQETLPASGKQLIAQQTVDITDFVKEQHAVLLREPDAPAGAGGERIHAGRCCPVQYY